MKRVSELIEMVIDLHARVAAKAPSDERNKQA